MWTALFFAGIALWLAVSAFGQESSSVEHPADQPNVTPSRYGYGELLALASNAGWALPDSDTAAAIALAESGGDPNAYNPETAAGAPPNMGSVGLWQIYRNAHPEFADFDLNNPAVNAQAAFSVWQAAGQSFRPWSTYKSGAWMKYSQVSA